MSIADPPTLPEIDVPIQPACRPLTASDLEAFPAELSSGPVDYELDNGRLVLIMSPPGFGHGSLQARLSGYLLAMGELKGHGRVISDTGLILWRNPDRLVSPDVAFVAARSLPVQQSKEGYLESIPQLVIEIRSKGDSARFISRKVEHYLKAGVEVVWVVDPSAKTVTIHTPTAAPIIRGASDTLELTDLIPGFALAVTDIFRE